MYGTNPRRAQDHGDGSTLWVQEVFPTLQGEGPDAGRPAVFVRLAGCNLACTFCDTDFESSTWRPTVDELVERIMAVSTTPKPFVVLTGGEPFRQNLDLLLQELLGEDIRVQVETNGTLFWPWIESYFAGVGQELYIICSPKTPTLNANLVPYIYALKYIVQAGYMDERGLPTWSTQLNAPLGRPIVGPEDIGLPPERVFLQPMDQQNITVNNINTTAAVNSCRKHGYRLSLQLHKLLGLP